MSHDQGRKGYYGRDRERDRDWERPGQDYRSSRDGGRGMTRKRSRSLTRGDLAKRRSRSPRNNSKDMIDDNLHEISKLPEPNDLWESNQFQDSGYPVAPPPPSFSREPSNQSYGSNYQPSYSGVYDDFPPLASAPQHPPEMSSWNQMALPPPPVAAYHNPEDQLKKEAAIESEMRHQKAALSKQREDYIKKSTILKKELDTLKDQRNELRGDAKRSPSPDTKRFLKENTKLQLEIQNKLKTINNVVDMLNGIIGEEAQELPETDESPERKRKSRSPTANTKCNYVYYDPEMHWCRVCNEFPPTAKDYLNHLHSPAHHKTAAPHMEAPWHSLTGVNDGFPNVPSAPNKRTPIRGLQFFVPSTAWYCKLCDQFIGDLHCASAHLKSIVHSKNYTNFVEQNPHWETDWMSDRQKAFEKARSAPKPKSDEHKPAPYTAHTITFSKDGFHTKRPKKSPSPQPEEKKKKKDKKKRGKKKKDSSSSSSSSSESSENEVVKKKKKTTTKSKKPKNIDVTDDKALEEWMSTIQIERLNNSDRKLLDSLKTRIKKEREEKEMSTARDIERITEMQRKIRESERRRSRSREPRDEKREPREEKQAARDERRESRDRREERARDEPRARDRWERRDQREEPQEKKPEAKKMPFIGKMPVYKSLGKTKVEEQKKEEQKKKEDVDNTDKKKQELDAEIQRKVLEFKEKIAKGRSERERLQRQQQFQQQQFQQMQRLAPPTLAPPALALPAALGSAVPPPLLRPPQQPLAPAAPIPPAAPVVPSQPALPKDFQEALDIIFPSDSKPRNDPVPVPQDLFSTMQQPPPNMVNVPAGMGNMGNMSNMGNMGMQSFPQMGMMQPPGMFGFDMNGPGPGPGMFPQPQLYDSHVPIMPNNQQNKQKQNKNSRNVKKNASKPDYMKVSHGKHQSQAEKANGDAAAKKKEELDDLAMLGIDATDVGAGI